MRCFLETLEPSVTVVIPEDQSREIEADNLYALYGQREIGGFDECRSLPQIEIPSSVEIISEEGF
jgi:hypothetical protein